MLVWLSGFMLLGFGALGLMVVLTYSGPLSRQSWLCLLAPAVGFGPCMVAASEYALTVHVSTAGWGLSVITGLLVSALLLMNQLPDRVVDARFGRRHLAIIHGPAAAASAYLLMMVMAAILLIAAAVSGVLPLSTLPAVLPFLLLVPILLQLRRHLLSGSGLTTALGANVLLVNSCLALISIGLWIG